MEQEYTMRFSATLTEVTLDLLRATAQLSPRGDLSDDAAELFGVRRLREAPGPVALRLYRLEEREWSFVLASDGNPYPPELVAAIRDDVRAAVSTAGGAVRDEQ